MAKRGRMKWMPAVVIDELEDIKREDDLIADAEACRKLVKYARVGREAQRMMRLDWSKKKSLPKVDSYPMRGGKRNKSMFEGML